MSESNTSRRRFIKFAMLGAASAPIVGGLALQPASANLPALPEDDATAKALGYHEDSTKVDAAKYPSHKNDQNCLNCNLHQPPQADGRLPCAIFPGKSVNAKGWCAAWVKKA
ncbi:MAG: high-potential iron-sulfur protein [Pseudomonadota bacterium]|jgi:hypothetical protein